MQIIVSRYSQVKLMPERVARPRKHPLALTLLSEHYKQLLQEFQDFRGSQFPADSSGSEASDVAHADEVSTTSTPAKQLYVDDNAADGKAAAAGQQGSGVGHHQAPQVQPEAAKQQASRGSGRHEQPRKKVFRLATPLVAGSTAVSPRAKKAHKQMLSARLMLPLTPANKRWRREHAAKLQGVTDFGPLQGTATTEACRTPEPNDSTSQQPQCVMTAACQWSSEDFPGKDSFCHHESAAVDTPSGQGTCTRPTESPVRSANMPTLQDPQAPPTLKPQAAKQQRRKHKPPRAVVDACHSVQTSARAGPKKRAAAAAAAPVNTALPASACRASSATRGVTGSAAAAALPKLPLQQLQGNRADLRPLLHPKSARTPPVASSADKPSKSEPASARLSRRTSTEERGGDVSTDGSCSSSSAGGVKRQQSLPDPRAMLSSRRHSCAGLRELAGKMVRPVRPTNQSDGGCTPRHTDGRSPQQQWQQQQQPPLLPLKQLLELRWRGQVRVGQDECRPARPPSHIQMQETTAVAAAAGVTLPPVNKQRGNSSSSTQQGARPQVVGTAAAIVPAPPPPLDWPRITHTEQTASPQHLRSRSSHTQLAPLDERTVLGESHLISAQQQVPSGTGSTSTKAAAAGASGMQAQKGGLEAVSSCSRLSRRSSRADSETSSGTDTGVGGLVCEPSSYGVCGDPAGAVHLVAPAISDKLARLKQRLPSRITVDQASAAVSAVTAAAAGNLEACEPTVLPSGLCKPEGDSQPWKALARPERPRARWQLPPPNTEDQRTTAAALAECQLAQSTQQGKPAALVAPGCDPVNMLRRRASHTYWPSGPDGLLPAHPPLDYYTPQGPQRPEPQAGSSSQQPVTWTSSQPAGLPAAAAHQASHQDGDSQPCFAEVRQQLDQGTFWSPAADHSHNRAAVPSSSTGPGQQVPKHLDQQQQLAMPELTPVLQPQQQQLLQNWATPHQEACSGSATGYPGGFIGPVPAHGALSRFTDPWAAKQQQRLLQQKMELQAAGSAGTAAGSLSLQQQQQQRELEQDQKQTCKQPTASALALLQQRQAQQQQVFKGMSLEAVLASAKKGKAPSKRQLMVDQGGLSGQQQ